MYKEYGKEKYNIEQLIHKQECSSKLSCAFGEGFVQSFQKQIKDDIEKFPKYIGNDIYRVRGNVNLVKNELLNMLYDADMNKSFCNKGRGT